ncbi:MAG TPA: M3 family metallopeptidase, partial [Gemmatimonadales bacterium]|nr:M3 family metallopeptidase [Gemmatimonadales bacterium]
RDYVFPAKFRFDYTPDDCARFHDAVEAQVMPAYERLMADRRAQLRLDTLRPWDLAVELYGEQAVRPFSTGTELADRAHEVFGRVDGTFGAQWGTMISEKLLDLDSREGKAPGGYCDTLHVSGRPFIFMNAVGLTDDVMTLLHEAGHAFHAFESHHHPFVWQRHPGSEMAELASMSMELLASPHLQRPVGFLAPAEWRQARIEHLEDVIVTLAHVASIDAFQHWVYTDPAGADADARDAAWLRIRTRFERGVAWDGLVPERVARWYRQLHVFLYPFYYIEYGIAQLGALQVWRNARRDPVEAVRRYREALALGATRPLPELYAAAGVRLAFDAATIGELVALVEEELDRLRGLTPAAA